jgi:methionine-rich copper-binding protein CopC
VRRLLVAAAAALAVAAAAPQGAAAHVGLKQLTPRPGSAHDKVGVVRATFRGRITDAKLVVRTAGGRKVSGARRMVDGRRAVRVPLRRPGRGTFRASLSWLSPDGHVVDRTWSFRIR